MFVFGACLTVGPERLRFRIQGYLRSRNIIRWELTTNVIMVGVIKRKREFCTFIITLGRKAVGTTVMVPGHGWIIMTTMVMLP